MRSRFLLVLVGFVVFVGPLAAATGSAHANYVSSDPGANAILPFGSAPKAVNITLSEAVQANSPTISVKNASGGQFAEMPVTILTDGRTIHVALLPNGPGIYTVAWTAISAVDGHFTAGAFAFAVQNADGSIPGSLPTGGPISSGSPISPLEVALKFFEFGGLALAFGGTVLARFVWIPAARDPDAKEPQAYGITMRILLHWSRIGALAFTIAAVGLWSLSTGLEASAGTSSLVGSPYLISLAVRVGIGAVMFLLLASAFARSRDAPPENLRHVLEIALFLGVAAIVAMSAGTHAASTTTTFTAAAIGVAANAAHLVGVGYWVGGLAILVAVRGFLRDEPALPLARYVLSGFSRFAFYAVGLVLIGGTVLALLLVGTADQLLHSAYGWVVLVKVALFAPMLAFGAYNRYRLLPKTSEPERLGDSVRGISSNVRMEMIIGFSVLLVAALLTSMTPAVSLVAPQPSLLSLDTTDSGLRINFIVVPYPTGPTVYTYEVLLYNATTGGDYNGGRNGTLTFTLENSGQPPQVVNLDGPHGNHFFVTSPAMSSAGLWRIDLHFARVDGFDVQVTFHVAVSGAS